MSQHGQKSQLWEHVLLNGEIEEREGCQCSQIHPFFARERECVKIIMLFLNIEQRNIIYFFYFCSEEPSRHKEERMLCVTYPSCQWECYFKIKCFIRKGKYNKLETFPKGVSFSRFYQKCFCMVEVGFTQILSNVFCFFSLRALMNSNLLMDSSGKKRHKSWQRN